MAPRRSRERGTIERRRLAASLAVLLGALAAPPVAGAATVSVTPQEDPIAGVLYRVGFEASGGEANQLTVSRPDAESYVFIDATAPIVAGEGCTGGGAPGVPAICRMPDVEATLDGVLLSLGDDADSLDAAGLPVPGVVPDNEPFLFTSVEGGRGRRPDHDEPGGGRIRHDRRRDGRRQRPRWGWTGPPARRRAGGW